MEKEMITISKDKIVLLSKLMKELKNVYAEQQGKELIAYKLRTQRRLLETILDDKAIDKFIDKLKNKIKQENLKTQIKEEDE